jgi:hypothetical protein
MVRFSEQIRRFNSGVLEPGQPKFLKKTDEGVVGVRRKLKATLLFYFGERYWLPLHHQTYFTLVAAQCTDLNSLINGTTLIPTLSNHLSAEWGAKDKCP